MKIFNLTQHQATESQIKDGVVELPDNIKSKIVALLTFSSAPTQKELTDRAEKIGDVMLQYLKKYYSVTNKDYLIAERHIKETHNPHFMIGGAPFFMCSLEYELSYLGTPVYAFSKRISIEEEIDGEVVKRSVFKHEGFIKANAHGR